MAGDVRYAGVVAISRFIIRSFGLGRDPTPKKI
jgi:hypothetical protein